MIENIKNYVAGWLFSFILAIIIVFILKTFVGMPTTVKGTSMASTLQPEEKLFLSTWFTNFGAMPKRGEIITFEAPNVDDLDSSQTNIAVYMSNSKTFWEQFLYYGLGISKSSYIKRVIGLPGDHVQIKDGYVYVNGIKYEEQYLDDGIKTDLSAGGNFDDVIVPEKCVFVLGDNRPASVDSRKFGCIPISKIEGKVVARWWPINKIGIM